MSFRLFHFLECCRRECWKYVCYNKTHDEDESTAGCSHMHKSGLVQLSVHKKTSAHDVKEMEVKSGTLSFCVHVKSQSGRHGQRRGSGGGGGDKRRRIFTCENETVGSLRCRWWQTIQAAAAEKRWSSEWHRAAGVDIIKQNVVNAKSHTSVSTLKVKGIHHMSGRKTLNLFFYLFTVLARAEATNLSINHPIVMLQVMQKQWSFSKATIRACAHAVQWFKHQWLNIAKTAKPLEHSHNCHLNILTPSQSRLLTLKKLCVKSLCTSQTLGVFLKCDYGCGPKGWRGWTYLCFGCRESWSICRAVVLSCSAKYLRGSGSFMD